MKKAIILATVVCMIASVNFTLAETIRGINIDFVTIGNAGNAADTNSAARPTGCGAVSYIYRIGKYEITNAQWDTFVSISGAPKGTDGDYTVGSYFLGAQKPAGAITWYEAAQLCNYLTSGDKSKGAYQFSGNDANAQAFLGIDRAAAKTAYGTIYVIPDENEFYKAAYFKADGSGYSMYANGTDTAPIAKVETNYGYGYAGMGTPWNVGSGSIEQNGTYDMMGNFWEWTESLWPGTSYRDVRGAAYFNPADQPYLLSSHYRTTGVPGSYNTTFTFRVVQLASCPVPPAGDLNGDCKVNFFDYAIFANGYTGTTANWLSLKNIADTWLLCGLANPGTCW